ncbi:MAG: TonB-dependent receptor [Gammaproteobacteria bacterium]|nr:TonB-dependent receptor [Gammaproteobacteria bacterium]
MNAASQNVRTGITAVAAALLAVHANFALARESGQSSGIEEIIVTAQKREQSLQSTTVSVTALTADMLEDASLPNLTSIERLAPNLVFSVSRDGSSTGAQAFIRGIGQFDSDVTTDPGVGIYVDGVYLARTVGANMEFTDIHQVQVLRGPQGTLYGKNTIGGAINVVTRVPSGEQDLSVEATYGSDDYIGLSGYAEFPLIENILAGSISVLSKQSDGWQKRNNGGNAGDDDMYGVRTHLNWTPSASFGSHLVLDSVSYDQNGYPRVLENFNSQEFFPFLYNTFVSPGDPCCTPNSDINKSNVLKGRDDLDSRGLSWTNTWDVGSITLQSITGYRKMDSEVYRDSDNDPKDFLSVGISIDHEQLSQEFIFSGLALNEHLDWIAGLYYFDEKSDMVEDVTVAGGLYEALSSLPLNVTLPDGTPLFFLAVPTDLTLHFDRTQDTINYAAYLHGIYSLTDRLRLTLAARYTYEEKDLSMFTLKQASQTPIVLPGATDPGECSDVNPKGNGSDFKCKESWAEVSPKIGLDYDINDDIMTYFNVSQGFRSGVINSRPLSSAEVSIADPETLISYEWGLKSTWLDRRLVVNGALFYNDYKDQQFLVNRSSASLGGGLALLVDNAGDSTIQGAELEFTAMPTESLTIFGGLGYTDAKFENFDSINPATGVLEDLSGRPFQDTPKWTANISAQYEIALANGSKLRVLADAYKDDVYYTNDEAAADFELLHPGGFTTYNAGIIFTAPQEHWQVALHGRNLSDERAINGGFTVDAFGLTDVAYNAPRRFYLSVKYQM